MISVRQYRPAFVSGYEDFAGKVPDAASLLALPFVASWVARGFTITCSPYCHHYRPAPDPLEWIIEAIRPDTHWVVAFTLSDVPELPRAVYEGATPRVVEREATALPPDSLSEGRTQDSDSAVAKVNRTPGYHST